MQILYTDDLYGSPYVMENITRPNMFPPLLSRSFPSLNSLRLSCSLPLANPSHSHRIISSSSSFSSLSLKLRHLFHSISRCTRTPSLSLSDTEDLIGFSSANLSSRVLGQSMEGECRRRRDRSKSGSLLTPRPKPSSSSKQGQISVTLSFFSR